MGAFFTNVQVYLPEKSTDDLCYIIKDMMIDRGFSESILWDFKNLLQPCRNIAIASIKDSDWLTVYDQEMENQDIEVMDKNCEYISRALNTYAVGILVHDSDVLSLRLFKDGKLIDEYVSDIELVEELTDQCMYGCEGKAHLWKDIADVEELGKLWHSEYVFAEEILYNVAELIGWSKGCTIGYKYFNEGSHDIKFDAMRYLKFKNT